MEKKIARAQRLVSRRKKGGKNRAKALRRVQLLHEKVAAQRKDFCHKNSRMVVSRYDLIAVEKLSTSGMRRGRFAKSIHDASWGIFFRNLTYKCSDSGKTLVEVQPHGTSQICSGCGKIVRKSLSDRVHECSCGLTLDRDVNAARNILIRAVGAEFTPVESRGATKDDEAGRVTGPLQSGLV